MIRAEEENVRGDTWMLVASVFSSLNRNVVQLSQNLVISFKLQGQAEQGSVSSTWRPSEIIPHSCCGFFQCSRRSAGRFHPTEALFKKKKEENHPRCHSSLCQQRAWQKNAKMRAGARGRGRLKKQGGGRCLRMNVSSCKRWDIRDGSNSEQRRQRGQKMKHAIRRAITTKKELGGQEAQLPYCGCPASLCLLLGYHSYLAWDKRREMTNTICLSLESVI